MSGGVLVKLAGAVAGAQPLAAVSSDHDIEPLFTVPARPGLGVAAAAPVHRWVRVRPQPVTAAAEQAAVKHPWDLAHEMRWRLQSQNEQVLTAEPDLDQAWFPEQRAGTNSPAMAARAADRIAPDDQAGSPYARGPRPAWHLDDDFSQLRAARDAIGAGPSAIKIVHLDTGFDPGHKACPTYIIAAEQRNFVDAGQLDNARDETPTTGLLLNRGHGTGTLGILAGPRVSGVLPTASGASLEGETIGGAPMMQIVPVRIADSVVHFGTGTVAQGIDYAVSIKADVVSMSMGPLRPGPTLATRLTKTASSWSVLPATTMAGYRPASSSIQRVSGGSSPRAE